MKARPGCISTNGTFTAALCLGSAALALAGANADAGTSNGALRVALIRADDGAVQVDATGAGWSSRITGFGFGAEPVWLGQEDVDRDGDLDIVVTNISSGGQANAGDSPGSRSSSLTVQQGPPSPAVFAIIVPSEGLPPTLDVSEGGPGIGTFESSVRGDRDNFGYGPFVVPPCVFFDNRQPQDLRVFDYESGGDDDHVNRWRHTFSLGGAPDSLVLHTTEIFSDRIASTIDLDGHTLGFATEPFAYCDQFGAHDVARNFVLSGSDAAIAADGAVIVTFRENGDDIALEYSQMTVHVP